MVAGGGATVAKTVDVAVWSAAAIADAQLAAVLVRFAKIGVNAAVSAAAPGQLATDPVCGPTTATPTQNAATPDAQAAAIVAGVAVPGAEMTARMGLETAVLIALVTVGTEAPKLPSRA